MYVRSARAGQQTREAVGTRGFWKEPWGLEAESERKAAAWGRSSSSRVRGLCTGPFGSYKGRGGSQVRFLKPGGQCNGEEIRPRPGRL